VAALLTLQVTMFFASRLQLINLLLKPAPVNKFIVKSKSFSSFVREGVVSVEVSEAKIVYLHNETVETLTIRHERGMRKLQVVGVCSARGLCRRLPQSVGAPSGRWLAVGAGTCAN
jgi:hypothetical protein